jgi:hypothetical protein
MNQLQKWMTVGLLSALVIGGGAVTALADEDVNPDDLPHIDDQRVNAFDVAAPVAVFYTYEDVLMVDDNGDAIYNEESGLQYESRLTGLELIGINLSDTTTYGVLNLSMDEIAEAVEAGQTTWESMGFTLGIGDNGYFYVVSPADFEGKVYSFVWDDLGRTLPTAE